MRLPPNSRIRLDIFGQFPQHAVMYLMRRYWSGITVRGSRSMPILWADTDDEMRLRTQKSVEIFTMCAR